MTDPERLKLLFVPYKAPPLKRGDRATCLFRDCEVVVTCWTDAPIPWPRCRALDNYRGGGSGLLVDEELARAVRHESAAAVIFWGGASKTAVQNWRRALSVGRTDNEGTARLVLAAAEKGAEAVKARDWTEKERGRRRRNAVEKGLVRNLVTGYHGPLWTAEEIALLGTARDEEVARRIGRTPNAVRVMRERLGKSAMLDAKQQLKSVLVPSIHDDPTDPFYATNLAAKLVGQLGMGQKMSAPLLITLKEVLDDYRANYMDRLLSAPVDEIDALGIDWTT